MNFESGGDIFDRISSSVSIDQQEPNGDIFDRISIESKVEEPEKPSSIGRQITRTGARVAETVFGLPGDLIQMSKVIGDQFPDLGEKKDPNFVQKYGQKLADLFPTSESLKKFSSGVTAGFTDPQSASEEFGDEIVSLAASLSIPAKNPAKLTSLLKSLGLSSSAVVARHGAEELGAGVKGQAAAELGALFLLGSIGKKSPGTYIGEKYQRAKAKIPENASVSTKAFKQGLNDVEKELSKGVSTATKKEVLEPLRQLSEKAQKGSIEVRELTEAYQNINERMASRSLFDDLNPTNRKRLSRRYNSLKSQINQPLAQYGKTNPGFYNEWKEANQAFATLAQSNKISSWATKQSTLKPFLSGVGYHILGGLATGGPTAAIQAGTTLATTGAIIAPIVKTGQILNRVAKSPTLRRFYVEMLEAAAAENAAATATAISKFDKQFELESD